jgi:hypothetical protein
MRVQSDAREEEAICQYRPGEDTWSQEVRLQLNRMNNPSQRRREAGS